MQALSLAVHIPLVCFGIALPALVLFAEWRYLRTGDPLYRTLARRWSKIMLALFAVGVVTGTILSFELGLLWPVWIADFGNVFGLGFTLEGFSFFVEAIFIGIYVYGWDRISPRMHLLSGIPVIVAGIAVIEEAPNGARAYSASMLALAGGFGHFFDRVTTVGLDGVHMHIATDILFSDQRGECVFLGCIDLPQVFAHFRWNIVQLQCRINILF